MDNRQYFKNKNVFMILGHGNNFNSHRFELKKYQYGGIPTKCGEELLFNKGIHPINKSLSLSNIPIPLHNIKLKNVSKKIPFTFFNMKSQKQRIQIYRPKKTNNTKRSSSIYTMPNLNVLLISYWLVDTLSRSILLPRPEEIVTVKLGQSGIVPIFKVDNYYDYYYIPKTDLDKPIKDNNDKIYELIKESLEDSIIPFDDILLIALMNKYMKQYKINNNNFAIFKEIKTAETLDDSYSRLKDKITIMDLLNVSIPLQFIYDYISSEIIKDEPFLLISPICRLQSQRMTRRKKAKQRRESINYRENVPYISNNTNNNNPKNSQNLNNTNYENPQPPYMSSPEDPRQPLLSRKYNLQEVHGGRRITHRRASKRQK